MHIIEYTPELKSAAIELMTELQEFERGLSADRAPGRAMAAGHFEYLLRLCEARSGRVFLALSGTQVIGFVVVFLEAEDEADLHVLPEYKRYGWVSDLVVTEDRLGSGAATLLMNRAERHCASVGATHVRLAALHNNQRARRFYEKSGYTEYEVVYVKRI